MGPMGACRLWAFVALFCVVGSVRGADPPIVYASRDFRGMEDPRAHAHGVIHALSGRLLVRDARETRALVDAAAAGAPAGLPIDVADPSPSWDARKVLFAGYSTAEGGWRIYEVGADGTGLRQVTGGPWEHDLGRHGDQAQALSGYDDLDPCYLTDGRICFVSTRYGELVPPDRARATNLYVVNTDGSDVHRITTERFGADTPTVDPATGRVVYSRWWRSLKMQVSQPPQPDAGVSPNGPPAPDDPPAPPPAPPYYGPPPPPPGPPGASLNGESLISEEVLRGLTDEEFSGINCWTLASINPDGTGLEMFAGFRTNREQTMGYRPSFLASGEVLELFLHEPAFLGLPGRSGLRIYPQGAGKPRALGGPQTFGGLASFGSGLVFASAEPFTDGRHLLTAALHPAGGLDYDVYTLAPGGEPVRLFGDRGTAEVDAVALERRSAPSTPIEYARNQRAEDPPRTVAEAFANGSFDFVCENVFAGGPVDLPIAGPPPVGHDLTIEFYMGPQRSGAFPEDGPILVGSQKVAPDGRIEARLPAGVPLFEVLRRPDGKIALGRDGQAFHVGGFNFGTAGASARCVGCHAGHSMLPMPDEPSWTNIAASATVTASSVRTGSPGLFEPKALVDRRTDRVIGEWAAQDLADATSITFHWNAPVIAKEIVVYGAAEGGGILGKRDLGVRGFRLEASAGAGSRDVLLDVRKFIQPGGTHVAWDAREAFESLILTIYAGDVSGKYEGLEGPALAEVEVIGKAAASVAPAAVFLRGDANCDGALDVSDVVSILASLFQGAGDLCCADAGDVNADLSLDIADGVHALLYLFGGGAPPAGPFPECGSAAGTRGLGCTSVTACE